jgi:hypothetical protein
VACIIADILVPAPPIIFWGSGRIRSQKILFLTMVDTEFRYAKFLEEFLKISAKFRYRKIFFPATHSLCYSIEHNK